MIQNIFVPSRIGSYYIFSKRVLSFDITTSFVQASLVYFSRNTITLENSMTIALQDQNIATVISALKKIATTIGKYDEVVTSLSSSAVIFKEITLPFLGREKIQMIVRYEVEPFLPFTVDEAVIDFLITHENKETSQTTILVAAVRTTDLETYLNPFEKAGIVVTNVTLDVFALYDFYRHTMYVPQAQTSVLLIDFGIDVIRMVSVQKGIVKAVRLVPYGLSAMMHKMNHSLHISADGSLEDSIHDMGHDSENQRHVSQQLLAEFCKQITLSVSFFEKQIKNFIAPAKIICLGAGTQLENFAEQATEKCQIPVEVLDVKRVVLRHNIQIAKRIKLDGQYSSNIIIPLSATHYGDVNFLLHQQHASNNRLLNKQLLAVVCISIAIVACMYTYSNYQLKQWDIAYNRSKKEMINAVKDQMGVEIKNVKRVADIVSAAQAKLQQEKKVCFSFSQSNNNFLQSLEELSKKIDRKSLGLDLKKLSLHDKEVILQGQVKDFDALKTFEHELMELRGFTIKNIPAELVFTVTLLVEKDQDKNKE